MAIERAEQVNVRPASDEYASTTSVFEQYHRDGFVLVDEVFSFDEIEVLRHAGAAAVTEHTERTVYEVDAATVRSVYGIHRHVAAFAKLARHPRLVEAVRQLLGGDVYVYQSKLNRKAVFGSDVWPWHQDYIYWHNEDGMPAPRVLTAAVLLDDVTEINGPMSMIPGSHREGVIPHETYEGPPAGYEGAPAWISNVVAKLKYTIQRQAFVRLAITNGVVTPKARAGSVLFFDANVAHASPVNLSPHERSLAMFTYNRVDNGPPVGSLHRPDFLVERDMRPIVTVPDDALLSPGEVSP